MTVMVEREVSIPDLLDGINAPERWRVEYVEGEITMAPPADVPHNLGANRIARELDRHFQSLGLAYEAYQGIGYCTTANCSDTQRGNHLIPDLSVMTRAFTAAEVTASASHSNWISSAALDLVVELTSSNRLADTVVKVRAYGRMAIPHYLLVDRRDSMVTLFTKPTGDVRDPGYGEERTFPFGSDIVLPEPYPVLNTKTWW